MNDLDKELTEIIADLMLRTGKLKAEDNPKIFKQGLQYIKAHDEAKAKIQALISDQVAKARIDERTQAQQYLHGLTITPENQHLFDVLSRNNHNRIATLNGVKK